MSTTKPIDVTKMSKEELKALTKASEARLAEIKAEEDEKLLEENAKHLELLREHEDIFMKLIDHERTSCSDTSVSNGYSMSEGKARCGKCHLIEILRGEWGDEFAVRLRVDIYNLI